MIIDNKKDYAFSNEFHTQASATGIAVMEGEHMYWITLVSITPECFDPDVHAFCGFKCFRDLQTFLAIRGWTIKETYTGIVTPTEAAND